MLFPVRKMLFKKSLMVKNALLSHPVKKKQQLKNAVCFCSAECETVPGLLSEFQNYVLIQKTEVAQVTSPLLISKSCLSL